MKAAILPAVGAALAVTDVELTPPGPGEVRVRIAASGVCRSDLSLQDATLPHPLPCVPGHEAAGVVAEVGPGVDTIAEGDHVVLTWIVPCGRCSFCLGGQANLCPESMSAMGTHHIFDSGQPVTAGMGTATFAEETVVPAGAAIRIDDDVPLDVAALIGCSVTTGVGAALNTARGHRAPAGVIGCGGVGVNVIQGARIAGRPRSSPSTRWPTSARPLPRSAPRPRAHPRTSPLSRAPVSTSPSTSWGHRRRCGRRGTPHAAAAPSWSWVRAAWTPR